VRAARRAVQGEAMSYDPAVALDFFKSAGKPPTPVKKTEVIFEEKDTKGLFKRSKLYFVLDGEVSLIAGKQVLSSVGKGQIFGELAALTNAPRTATAVAKLDSTLIALDDKEFAKALEQKPAFALMLMSMLIGRLRETIAKLSAAGKLTHEAEVKESAAFDPDRLTDLVRGLANDAPIYYQQGRQIMNEGSKAALMYAVVSGRVAISIGGKVVERLGPGGAFGEAALLDQAPRLATAMAESDCELQPITRPAFLALVKSSPEFAYKMLISIAERLRFLTEKMK
jgi:CRP/FNR family transcriptional regulator, cyclic AMP receptor protein